MRKITIEAVNEFMTGGNLKKSNMHVFTDADGNSTMALHGNIIARRTNGELMITNAGWSSNTTKERLNGIPGVRINQKNFTWYLNGTEWDGSWVRPEGYGMAELEACPGRVANTGCLERFNTSYASLSRYGHGSLCSNCGVEEAFSGDFIAESNDGITSRENCTYDVIDGALCVSHSATH